MGIQLAVATCFAKYVTFQGRAPRSEYWWWAVFVLFATVVLLLVGNTALGWDSMAGLVLMGAFMLATILPGLAVTVRRLHDSGRGGGWFFIQLVPAIGPLWFLYFMVTAGTRGPNRFGDELSGA